MKNNNTLSDEELKELKSKAFDVLSHTRSVLLSKYPFIGSIALRMDLVPVTLRIPYRHIRYPIHATLQQPPWTCRAVVRKELVPIIFVLWLPA